MGHTPTAWTVEMQYISDCFGAISMGETLDLTWPIPTGRCIQCKEMTVFYEPRQRGEEE